MCEESAAFRGSEWDNLQTGCRSNNERWKESKEPNPSWNLTTCVICKSSSPRLSTFAADLLAVLLRLSARPQKIRTEGDQFN